MKVLVTGSRYWKDWDYIFDKLDEFHRLRPITHLIEGGASGADTIAWEWAETKGITRSTYPAEWDKYGKRAGPLRNEKMLKEGKPDVVIAFHEDLTQSKGTKHMVGIARKAGVEVIHYKG